MNNIITFTDCPDLWAPDYGQVTYTGNSHGSIATYSCHPGYILVGITNRTCGIGGSWSPPHAPICEGIYMYIYVCVYCLIAKNIAMYMYIAESWQISMSQRYSNWVFSLWLYILISDSITHEKVDVHVSGNNFTGTIKCNYL